MTEIQGKSIFVRVSARFELARVRVIGSRLYFHGKIETTESLQKLPMVPPAWNRDISPLPLKPPKSFKTKTTIFVVVGLFCFVLFSFGWPEPVRGRQCEETFQKSSWSQKKKNFPRLGRLLFLIFKLVSSTLWPFCCCCCCCFFTSSMLHLEVSRLKIVKH